MVLIALGLALVSPPLRQKVLDGPKELTTAIKGVKDPRGGGVEASCRGFSSRHRLPLEG